MSEFFVARRSSVDTSWVCVEIPCHLCVYEYVKFYQDDNNYLPGQTVLSISVKFLHGNEIGFYSPVTFRTVDEDRTGHRSCIRIIIPTFKTASQSAIHKLLDA